jgi:heme A synthase
LTGILIIATVVLAWVVWRSRRPIVAWLATASLIGVVGEGLLGAEVVRTELASWLVLFHLALAMIILGFLVAAAVMAMPVKTASADPNYRRLAAIAVGATYVLLLSGSTVVASGADEACHAWPLCGAGLTPDFTGVNAYTMLHRGAVLVIGALLVYVLVRGMRQPGLAAVSIATLVLLALQVAVGAFAAVTANEAFNGFHVALATLVWSGVLITALVTLPRTDRAPQLSRLALETKVQ